MVRQVISQALCDAQLCTMKQFQEYIKDKDVHTKEDVVRCISQFESNIMIHSRCSFRKKKEPSEFNLFIRDKIIAFKKLHPDYHGHTLMRMAIESWKSFAR